MLQHRAVAVSLAVANTVYKGAITLPEAIAVPKTIAVSGDLGDLGHSLDIVDAMNGWSAIDRASSDRRSHGVMCPVRVALGNMGHHRMVCCSCAVE